MKRITQQQERWNNDSAVVYCIYYTWHKSLGALDGFYVEYYNNGNKRYEGKR